MRSDLNTAALLAGDHSTEESICRESISVLISGGYGYGNVGDEAQLAANLQHWRRVAPRCRLTVLSPNIEYTRTLHGPVRVELAPRRALFARKGREYFGSVRFFKLAFPWIAFICLFNAWLLRAGLPVIGLTATQARLLNEVKETDVLFLSGGGYLTGMTLTRLWDNMLLIRLAHLFGVPVILSGQTIGVFKDRVSRMLARWGLKEAKLIYLRDAVDSPQDLAAIGLTGDRIKSTFDDALFFSAAPFAQVAEILRSAGIDPDKPYLAVNVHYWGQKAEDSRLIMKGMARALDCIQKDLRLQIVFVPMVHLDEGAIEEVNASMQLPGRMPVHGYRPDLAVGIIQNACLCVTMKHHPIIFAMAGAVPTVSITFDDYYHHKNHGAMKIFAQEDLLIKCIPEHLERHLVEKTKDAFERRAEISLCISAVVDELKIMSGEAISRFMKNRPESK